MKPHFIYPTCYRSLIGGYITVRSRGNMSNTDGTQDAITTEEMVGTTVHPLPDAPSHEPQPKVKNAFTELMKPKIAKNTTEVPSNKPKGKLIYAGRDGLGAYTEHPDHFPKDVILQDEKYVAIQDRFPKSTVHTLLLPRGDVNMLHPLEAFQDLEFLNRTEEKAQKLKKIIAKELRRKFGQFSTQDKAREAVLDGEVDLADGEELPKGRDWESEVLVGIHLHPSMNHLHIHVLSRDNYSGCLKHRNHYNSFNTPFFVRLDEFPLEKDDPRLLQNWEKCENFLERDMRCWRCGKNFGRSMARLKEHLKEEFEEWRKE